MPATTAAGEFIGIIRERTQHFSGREWVFEKVDSWLSDTDGERVFLLCGGPGTGKSTIAARLAQASIGEAALGAWPALQPGFLTYLHFCQAGVGTTLSPTTFVQSLSQAIANRIPTFRTALEAQGSQQIIINAPVNVQGSVAENARVGTEIGNITIQIRGGDARPMFDDAVRRPLKTLAAAGALEPIIVLVDSLDEALTFGSDTSIVRLLQLVNDFPPQVRFFLTSRSNNERVFDLVGRPTLDLITDAPPGIDEVRTYALGRLAPLPEPPRADLARRVAEESHGNFLYAYHVLNDLLRPGRTFTDASTIELPDKLEGVYRSFLGREVSSKDPRWRSEFRPLLGAIVVARGDGLTRSQLSGVTQLSEEQLDDLLDVLHEYLVGGDDDADPLRIYHQSFREFLVADPDYQVYPAARHEAIAVFLLKKYGARLSKGADEYALRHAPVHLAEAARGSEPTREALVSQLIELTGDKAYQDECDTRLHDIPMLNEHLARAVAASALCETDEMLRWIVRAGNNYSAFRERFLRGDSVIALAERGNTAAAEGRLPLFAGLDRDWQYAASLVIAWLAKDQNAGAATEIVERVAKAAPDEPPLPLLLARVRAAIAGEAKFDFEAGPEEDPYFGEQLVRRMAGQAVDGELLASKMNVLQPLGQQSELIEGRGYAASLDGPVLVNIARAHGEEGTALLDRYIDAHAGYNYVEYRNKSLWVVLHAVLRHHGDQSWVAERLKRLLGVALMSGGSEYREGAPLFASALLERMRGANVRAVVDAYSGSAHASIEKLRQTRGANDSWGIHRRRLIALMELEALGLGDQARSQRILKEIREFDQSRVLEGFAGFQAPAMARLADALVASGIAQGDEVASTITTALMIAHRIQDFRFCARITARCQTLQRWHAMQLSASVLEEVVERFARAPLDAEFAADHVIGDAYKYRNHGSPETLPIQEAQAANTLEKLADVFQRPAVTFMKLNPGYLLADEIPAGTTVKVPDPGLAPLLAVHYSARALGRPGVAGNRAALVRSVVPMAAENATALDSVMGYLLVAANVEETVVMEKIAGELGTPAVRDEGKPEGEVLQRRRGIPA